MIVLTGTGCDKYQPPEKPVADSKPAIEIKPSWAGDTRAIRDPQDQPADQPESVDQHEPMHQHESMDDSASVDRSESEDGADDLPTLADSLQNDAPKEADEADEAEKEVHTIDIPKSWTRLSPRQEIWVDMSSKQVIAGGYICLNAGPLEVFVCPRYTKEHESVVAINASSQQVHAALLAIGAEPGKPVQWIDEYQPATGDVIEVSVMWKQDDELVTRRGQEMILNIKTGKTMQHDWVFGGSIIETIEATEDSPAQTYYLADSGELVCVSNFSTATMDVPVRSSDANEGLLFEAHTPNIPDVGTKVYVIFNKKK